MDCGGGRGKSWPLSSVEKCDIVMGLVAVINIVGSVGGVPEEEEGKNPRAHGVGGGGRGHISALIASQTLLLAFFT